MKLLLLMLALPLLFAGCTGSTEEPARSMNAGVQQHRIKSVEVRTLDLLVKYRAPIKTFEQLWKLNSYSKVITNDSTLLIIDTLLPPIGNTASSPIGDVIVGMIVTYQDGQQDTVAFGYNGIKYRGSSYRYSENADLVLVVSEQLPDENKIALQLAIHPNNIELQQKLQEAIRQRYKKR